VKLWQWLREQIDPPTRRTILPPEPYDEAAHRLDLAIERTQRETRRLAVDGSDLARRIERNARAGRDALQGKPT
jgi:hypothetical protein